MTLSRGALLCCALGVVSVAGCTSSGSSGPSTAPTTPQRAVSSAPQQPDLIDRAATAELSGSAVVRVSGQAPTQLASPPRQPVQLEITAGGLAHVTIAMQGGGDDFLTLDGRIRAGETSRRMHVALLLGNGAYVDTDAGNTCTVTMTTLTESALAGSATCNGSSDQNDVRVAVSFTAHG